MQQARADAGPGSGVTGHAIARCHVGVGPVVNVQQRTLGPFKQQIGAIQVRLVELARDIGHHGLEQLSLPHRLIKHRLEQHLTIGHIGCQSRTKIKCR